MTWKWGPLAALACVLLAAWALSGPERGVSAGGAHRAARAGTASDPVFADLGSSTARLRRTAPALPDLRRNLFTFRDAPAPSPRRRSPAVVATAVPPVLPRPEMQLEGIAEEGESGQRVRTAVVSAVNQLFFLKEGDRLLGRYLVTRIGTDAVQMTDGDLSFTLALR